MIVYILTSPHPFDSEGVVYRAYYDSEGKEPMYIGDKSLEALKRRVLEHFNKSEISFSST